MAETRPSAFNDFPDPRSRQPAGGDAARFAAAALPPHRGANSTAGASGAGGTAGGVDEIAAARAAAAHYDALYGNRTRPSRRFSRWMIMPLIFAIGAGAGLGGARLFGSMSAPAAKPAISVASVQQSEQANAAGMRGIRASELPYDGGLSAPKDEEDSEILPRAAAPAAAVSPGAGTSGSSAPASSASGAPPSTPSAPAAGEAERARNTEPTSPPKTAKRSRPQAKAASQAEKNREIERIKRQVEEELEHKKRDTAASDPQRNERLKSIARASAGTAQPRALPVAAELASCDRGNNIFAREQCRWRICNGRWGKNGCPSFKTRDPY